MLSHAALLLLFSATSTEFNLPKDLLKSICLVESGYHISAINKLDGSSPSLGVCQIKYTTARQMGYRETSNTLLDPVLNIYYAGKYLSWQLNRYKDTNKAIAAYNSGTILVDKNGRICNHKYVQRVLKVWRTNEITKKKSLSKVYKPLRG